MNGQEISLEALAVEHTRAVCLLIGESGCNPPLGGPKRNVVTPGGTKLNSSGASGLPFGMKITDASFDSN